MGFEWTPRERRWLDALLVLATLALLYIVLGFAGSLFLTFGDVILVFFLAWLLAFMLSPIVAWILSAVPLMSRVVAVAIVYTLLFGGLVFLIVAAAGALATSVADFIGSVPELREDLPGLLASWQEKLDGLGVVQVDLVAQATAFLDNLDRFAAELAGPLQQIAVASLGAIANLLLIVIFSLYMVADRDRILSFVFRLVPPALAEDARLLESSVARSFGGFLRGQAIMGVLYAAIAVICSTVFGLDYIAATSAAAGVLMAVPFFGPFVAWAPPVLVAILARPDAILGSFAIMGIGWLIVMNVVQPRIMSDALRIHPIVVLGSVIVGAKLAGISGAIFGVPIAAVIAAFFYHWMERTRDIGPVAARAAKRLEERQGHPVRMPREPRPGEDPDVEPASGEAPPG